MPFNFLELLPSYRKAKVRKTVRRRRDIVARYLTAGYGFVIEDPNRTKAWEEAKKAGLQTTELKMGNDARLFRTAYEYLCASPEEQQKMREKITASRQKGEAIPDRMLGITYLMPDGISTWQQILELKAQQDKLSPPEAEEADINSAAAEEAATTESFPLPTKEAGETPGRKEEKEDQIDLKTIAQNVAEFLPQAAQAFAAVIPRLLQEITERERKISLLSGQNRSLQQQAQSLLANMKEAQDRASEWEKFALEIDEKKQELSSKTLRELAEEIATESERGMEVLRSVNRYEEERAARQREQSRLEIINGFPETVQAGNMTGRKFVYEQNFLEDLRWRSKEDQQKVRLALQKFSEHGENYSSLHTHPVIDDYIQCLPEGCFSSRASDELRIFWRKEGEEIHLHRLGRKGEEWLDSSET